MGLRALSNLQILFWSIDKFAGTRMCFEKLAPGSKQAPLFEMCNFETILATPNVLQVRNGTQEEQSMTEGKFWACDYVHGMGGLLHSVPGVTFGA